MLASSPSPRARGKQARWFGGPVASVIVVLVVLWCLYGLGQGVLAGELGLAGVFPLIALAVIWFFHVPRRT